MRQRLTWAAAAPSFRGVAASLRAICFDLDNTLWHVDPVIARAEARLELWLREHYPRIPERWSIAQLREARVALAASDARRAHDFTWLRTESMARLAREVGYPETMAEEAYAAFHGWRNEVEAFPDVVPALRLLGARYRLATLSNGNADLARIGLAGHFSVSLAAGALGFAKPDRRAFLAVAEAIGCEPAELLYVGDDPEIDVEGARLAGLRTAWINRFAKAWPASLVPAEFTVVDCEDLCRHVRVL